MTPPLDCGRVGRGEAEANADHSKAEVGQCRAQYAMESIAAREFPFGNELGKLMSYIILQ